MLLDRRKLEPNGEPSLQNAIEMARGSMGQVYDNSQLESLPTFYTVDTFLPTRRGRLSSSLDH